MGGLEGLPENGEKGYGSGKDNGNSEDPAIAGDPVGILLQKLARDPYRKGNCHDGRDGHQGKIFKDSLFDLPLYSAAEDLPDRDVAGVLSGIVTAHSDEA